MVHVMPIESSPRNRERLGRRMFRCRTFGCTFSNEGMCRGRAENGQELCQNCLGIEGKKKATGGRGRKPTVRKTITPA